MKNALKKAISVLLVAVMVFGAAPLAGFVDIELNHFKAEAATYGGTCGENLTWTLDTETGELVINGTGNMWDWSWANKKTVPWYNYRSYIKSLNIGNSVTSIGDSAFNTCKGITDITIDNNITSIGSRAFYQCDGLTNVTIGNGVISIGARAFWNCQELATVTIGKGVKSIGDRAFCACYSLENITVDSANTAYSNDTYGVLFNKDKTELIQYPAGNKRTSYTIPDSVTSIGNGAFFGCEELTSVKIGSNVNSIGEDVFQLCKNLIGITIPCGVTSIGKSMFSSCYNLKSITIPDSVKNIGDSAFANCTGLSDVYYSGTEEEWGLISVGNYNDELADATLHFNYVSEEPSTTVPLTTAPTTTRPTTTVPATTRPAETTTHPTTTATTTRPDTTRPVTTKPSITKPVIPTTTRPATTATTTRPATTRPVTTRPSTTKPVIPTTKPVLPPVTENEVTIYIRTPSLTSIRYGDSIILHAESPDGLPAGYCVQWTASNGNFSCFPNGTNCRITPVTSGSTTFTVTVYDASGTEICKDEQTMTSKAGFFDKITAFFKKLFGINQIIPEAFRGIV